jgi:recombinational DNA repair ATPase RecF
LLNRITSGGQTLLTTTDLDLFTAGFIGNATLWEVQDGRIEQLSN